MLFLIGTDLSTNDSFASYYYTSYKYNLITTLNPFFGVKKKIDW